MKATKRWFMLSMLFPVVVLFGPYVVSADPYWVFFQPETGWETGEPVPETMVRSVAAAGARIRTVSRYFHAVSVDFEGDPARLGKIAGVTKVQPVAKLAGAPPDAGAAKPVRIEASAHVQEQHLLNYGISYDPLSMLKIPELHDLGLTGKGVVIGVLDAGFDYKNTGCLKHLNVIHTRNFVKGGEDVSGYQHGTAVLGCLAGKYDHVYYGAAFGATFILALTEHQASETHADEDRWVAGVEWCDSLGVDIISSSVGYAFFDSPETSYTTKDMDGKTTLCARAAEIACSRGIIVVNSVGNNGQDPGKIIASPADAEHVVAVGAVRYSGTDEPQLWPNSSRGPTADERIKPDVVACGYAVNCPTPGMDDIFTRETGTSLSAPFISGLCALLMEAHPDWNSETVVKAIKAASRDLGAPGPDNNFGWGLPDGMAALNYQPSSNAVQSSAPTPFAVTGNHPNPFNPSTTIEYALPSAGKASLAVYSITGQKVRELVSGTLPAGKHSAVWDGRDDRGTAVSSGVYISHLRMGDKVASGRMMLVK